jgi:hypothetical protein
MLQFPLGSKPELPTLNQTRNETQKFVNQSLKSAETFLSTVNNAFYFEIISIITAVVGLVVLMYGIEKIAL